ncbi:hypothetical protein GJ633_02080 [Halorubrum sp. CBA1125]|nr:hypothetical protein [Halorubrum sp. CBA1125]
MCAIPVVVASRTCAKRAPPPGHPWADRCRFRFAEIEEHLPTASTSTISKRLDEFEEAGLISRTQYNEIPPRVEYSLTDDGDAVQARLEPLLEWASTAEELPTNDRCVM